MIPDWWEFALLSLAAFRVWKLLAEDVIFDGIRESFLQRYEDDPEKWKAIIEFLACGWCLGFWCGVAWWASWLVWDYGTLVFATPWAIGAAVGIIFHALETTPVE